MRTVLVHVNVSLDDDDERNAGDVAGDVELALEAAPSPRLDAEVVLAEEV